MNAVDRARKNILEFRNVREDIIGETAVGYYYDYLTSELKVDNLPIIICNTLEKRTSFVETHKKSVFFLYLITMSLNCFINLMNLYYGMVQMKMWRHFFIRRYRKQN